MNLSNAVLESLDPQILRPTYDRGALMPGIVHIGVGNFHRAHQAWYLHRLMQMGEAQDWAILGAGVREYDAAMRERLLAQDCLTTLIELAPDHRGPEVTGAMIDYLPIEDGNGPLIRAMADPAIRIVSLTVTEGGYFLDPVTKEFDPSHPDIQHDIANPAKPVTAFGAIVAALSLRRDAGHGPFTGMSCDNLIANGDVLRKVVLGLAEMIDPDLAGWIAESGAFPNSMVDCIVPATGPAELALVQEFGITDQAPVTHENFRQWVVEDTFCAGRPPWEKVGATLTDDVHAYELQKLRVLNAGHQLVANVGEILSKATVADCMADPQILAFFRKVQRAEITPLVPSIPGTSALDYAALIEQRFSNPAIVDTVRRIAFDGSSRHPGFVIPQIHDALERGTGINGLCLSQAFWARMCYGVREDGSVIEANDPAWNSLQAVATEAKTNPAVWIGQSKYYGDLAQNEAFRATFTHWLNMIWEKGARAALDAYAKG